jgi:hypothetical protein
MRKNASVLPSVSQLIWVIFFLALAIGNWRLVMINADGDPSLHWRLGEWMLQHRQMVRADQFSHTRFGAPLVSKEWLSEIFYAISARAFGGWNGFVLLAAALIATTLWFLHRQLRAEGRHVVLATAVVLVAAWAGVSHWLARPHLFTLLLVVIFNGELRKFARGERKGTMTALMLAPLSCLWANLHGGFVFGFAILAAYAAGIWLESLAKSPIAPLGLSQKRREILFVLLACLIASLINPNGARLHTHIISFFGSPLADYAQEFRAPDIAKSPELAAWLLVVALMFIVKRPKLRIADVILLLGFGYLALKSGRNVPIFALVAAPIVAEHCNFSPENRSRLRLWCDKLAVDLGNFSGARLGVPQWMAIAAVAWAMTSGKIQTDIMPERFPVRAVEFLRAKPDAVCGEMFNDYGWGGWLLLALPERRVFIDGRNDFYGAQLVGDFDEIYDVKPNWEGVMARHNVGWTLLKKNHPLHQVLARDPHWERVYADDVTMIFTRR